MGELVGERLTQCLTECFHECSTGCSGLREFGVPREPASAVPSAAAIDSSRISRRLRRCATSSAASASGRHWQCCRTGRVCFRGRVEAAGYLPAGRRETKSSACVCPRTPGHLTITTERSRPSSPRPMRRDERLGVPPELPDTTVRIGEGTANGDGIWQISNSFYCCQLLYLAAEMNFSGTIRKVAFFANHATDIDSLCRSHHYLKDVAETCFTLPGWDSTGTEVWSGNLFLRDTGWLDLQLQVPFHHQQDRNLQLSYRHLDSTSDTVQTSSIMRLCTPLPSGCRAKRGGSDSDTLPRMTLSPCRVNIALTCTPDEPPTDVQTLSILSPTDSTTWGQLCVPKAIVRNNGVAPATFSVQFRISDGYSDTSAVTNLPPGAEDTVSFAPWTPDSAGPFSVKCSTPCRRPASGE